MNINTKYVGTQKNRFSKVNLKNQILPPNATPESKPTQKYSSRTNKKNKIRNIQFEFKKTKSTTTTRQNREKQYTKNAQ